MSIKRDIAAVKRNRVRHGFLDVVREFKLSSEEAKRLFADALAKNFEDVRTEITPEPTMEEDGKPCSKCGKMIICRYGVPICKRCKYEKVAKLCVDCKIRVDPKSTRCFTCNRKHMISHRKFNEIKGKK